MNRQSSCFILVAAICTSRLLLVTDRAKAESISIDFHPKVPQAAFAAERIRAATQQAGHTVVDSGAEVSLLLKIDPLVAKPQGYVIRLTEDGITVTGGDARGVMYGGLEFAERLQLNKDLPTEEIRGEPYLSNRGIKMNIPLDARTPSYDDTGDAARQNTIQVWDFNFWREYLDTLAEHRYNALTFWNPHPFPSMVKLEQYPDVALNDVCITTLVPEGKENEWGEPQCVATNVIENLKVIKQITIEEKIAFWKKVMRHAQDRGIDVYFITWNICPNSVARAVRPGYRTYGIDIWDEPAGKHGVTHQINDPDTLNYYRDTIKTFLLTYPGVKGIGVTAGEHMPHKQKEYPVEKWLWDSYGQGILDAKKLQPDRKVHFIHRIWNTGVEPILEYWDQYPDSFEFSFKYAKARLYSTPAPPFAKWQIKKFKPHGLKCWWNLRNDDIFVHRWGDPDYVREFLTNFDLESTAGYHMGSDGYVWGREFVSKHPEAPRQLEFHKHWYRTLLWGRLGYNPQLDRSFFVKKLAARFPETDAELLYTTWQAASRIIPQVNVFHWRDWDFMFAVEGCLEMSDGFRSVLEFVDNPTLQDSGILNPTKYVQAIMSGQDISGMTPHVVAEKLEAYAQTALDGAEKLTASATEKSLQLTLSDIQGMAWLGRYYANKIRAAVEVAWYQQTAKPAHQAQAITLLEKALESWQQYARISTSKYKSQYLARTQKLDWQLLTEEVKRDVQLVKELE